MDHGQLHSKLYSLIENSLFSQKTRYANLKRYRDFYLFTTQHKFSDKLQKYLEKQRPTLDYIQISDGRILVGATEDFEDLKKAALELHFKLLVDITKQKLAAMQDLIQVAQFKVSGKSYYDTYPELFI